MENQVQQLLQAEKEVNALVQSALKEKREKMTTLTREVEIGVSEFKTAQVAAMEAKLA